MKRYSALFLCALMVISCQRETVTHNSVSYLTASFADPDLSKTVLDSSLRHVLWAPNDEINVFYGESQVKFTALCKKPSACSIFGCDQSVMFIGCEGSDNYIWAVYPYNSNNAFLGNSVDLEVSSRYDAEENTFENGKFPSIARSHTTTMSFYNICSGFCFTPYHDNIRSITVTSLDSVALAGRINASFDDNGKPVVNNVYEGYSASVTLSSSNGPLTKGTTYYLPSLPASFTKGFHIVFRTASTQSDTTIVRSGILPRSSFVRLKSIDSALVFKVSVQSLTIDRKELYLTACAKETLTATIMPEDASDKSVTWSSSDTSIADVDVDGNVEARDVSGSCVIYARSNQNPDICDSCAVIVNKNVVKVAIDTASISMYPDSTWQLRATALPAGVSDTVVLWKSLDNNIASVSDEGLVTAHNLGQCYIIAYSHENEDICDTCVVSVVKQVERIAILKSKIELFMEESDSISAILYPEDAFDKSVTFSSDNESVVTVDEKGVITPTGGGYCNVIVKSKANPAVFATCAITIKDGPNLSAKGYANTYIAPSAGWYKFNANAKGITGTALGTSSIKLLWEYKSCKSIISKGEIVSRVELHNDFAYFEIPSPVMNGDAFIAAYDDNGNILWSWLIWVANGYDIDATAQVYKNNAGTMMDRNLGAVSESHLNYSGVSFQWGRKDPFPIFTSLDLEFVTTYGAWPAMVSSTAQTGTIAYTVEHPMEYIAQNFNNNDWFYDSSSADYQSRWSSTKTDYDPCPVGWKVPAGANGGVWATAAGSASVPSAGYWQRGGFAMAGLFTDASVDCWYPSCGYMSTYDATYCYYASGSMCGLWSSTHKDSYAYIFHATNMSTVLETVYGDLCYNGYPVRCVKESK